MKIAYRSRTGMSGTVISQLRGHELGTWADGQERDVPDDLMLPVQTTDRRTVQAKAVDAILLASPDFVDAATGVHPDYACAACGREELSSSYPGMVDGLQRAGVPYENASGEKVCVRDYLLALPESSFAWRWHRGVEYSQGLTEAEAVLAARKAGVTDDLPKPPAAATDPLPEAPPPASRGIPDGVGQRPAPATAASATATEGEA
jgi:hypothetical protein